MEKFNKLYNASEKRVANKIYSHLRAIYKTFSDMTEHQSPQAAIAQLNRIDTHQWSDLLLDIYTKEAAVFYLYQQSELASKKDFVRSDFQTGFFSEVWKQIMKKTMANVSLFSRITNTSQTTRDEVRAVLTNAIENRVGSREAARMLRQRLPFVKTRALTIARTETTFAASLGKHEAAKRSELPLLSQWIHGGGGRVPRSTHQDLDGSTVKMGERFNVNGTLMEYPGDPAGGAAECINCTCTSVYIVDESRL